MQPIVSILQTIHVEWRVYVESWAPLKDQTVSQCYGPILLQYFLLRNLQTHLNRVTLHPKLGQRQTFLSYLLQEVREELRPLENRLTKVGFFLEERIQSAALRPLQEVDAPVENPVCCLGALCTLLGSLALMNSCARELPGEGVDAKSPELEDCYLRPTSPGRFNACRILHWNQLLNTVKGIPLTEDEILDLIRGAESKSRQILEILKSMTREPEPTGANNVPH